MALTDKRRWFDKNGMIILWLVLFAPVGLYGLFKNKSIKKPIKVFLGIVFSFWMLILIIVGSVSNEESETGNITNEDNNLEIPNETDNLKNAVEFTIVEKEDISIKALGQKKLSDYSSAELEALPLNKRMSYRVVVPPTIKEIQVLPTFQKIVKEIISSDYEIDQIVIFMYSDKKIINGIYDVAKAEWAPNGEWGTVTPKIAQNNDRSYYKIKMEIKEDLENYLENRNKSEIKFGFTVEERQQIFIELVEAEDKAMKDADDKYPIVATGTMDDLKMNAKYNNDQLAIYEAEVREKYNLDEEKESAISLEGLLNNWPFE